MVDVAPLAERNEVSGGVVGSVVVAVRSGKNHPGPA